MGTKEGTEITKKGDLIMGKIIIGQGLVDLVPVDAKIIRIHGNPVDVNTIHIHESPVNVGTIHIHMSMQTGVRIPQKNERPRNATMDAMSRALRKATQSTFSDDIERAQMLSRFTRPPFNSYNRKTNPVEHVSHYI